MLGRKEIEYIRFLRLAGYTYRQISYLTGISYPTVVKYGRKVKPAGREISSEIKGKVVDLYRKTGSVTIISLLLGVRANDAIKVLQEEMDAVRKQ